MTINSEKSSDCGKSSLSFRPVSRRLFGIESHVEEAFGEETEQMQFLQLLALVPIPKIHRRHWCPPDLAVAVALGVSTLSIGFQQCNSRPNWIGRRSSSRLDRGNICTSMPWTETSARLMRLLRV
jgi:hypothetical protein